MDAAVPFEKMISSRGHMNELHVSTPGIEAYHMPDGDGINNAAYLIAYLSLIL